MKKMTKHAFGSFPLQAVAKPERNEMSLSSNSVDVNMFLVCACQYVYVYAYGLCMCLCVYSVIKTLISYYISKFLRAIVPT